MNTTSPVTRGEMENDELKKQAPPPPPDATQKKSASFSEKVAKTKKDDTLVPKSPRKPPPSTLRTSEDAEVTENDSESSLPQRNTVHGAGNKRKKETESPTSPTSPQAKQPRLNEEKASDTADNVINNTSDAQTESDEYDSEDQKVHGGTTAPDVDSAFATQQSTSQEPSLLERVAKAARALARDAPSFPESVAQAQVLPDAGSRQSFPHLMYRLLEDEEYNDALCWLEGGVSFAIDPDVFQRKVIAVYFRGSKFDSFKRKLNRWGFRRVMETEAPGTMTYCHRLFRRGFPALLSKMNGGRIMGKKETNLSMERKLENQMARQHSAVQQLQDYPHLMALMGQNLPRASAGGGFPGAHLNGSQGSVQQLVSAEGIPTSIPPSHAGGSMRVNDFNKMMLIEQERLRLELERKSQDELLLRQKLNEEIFHRRAQEEQMRELLLFGVNSSRPSDVASLQQSLARQLLQGTSMGMDPRSAALSSSLLQGMMPSQFRQAATLPQDSNAIRMPIDGHPPASSPMATGSSSTDGRNAQLGQFQSLEQNHQGRDNDYTRLVNAEIARRRELDDQNGTTDRVYEA